ncbi:MAG TPA: hypothetical protein VGC32_01015 [Solirubrobacterales bacterium]
MLSPALKIKAGAVDGSKPAAGAVGSSNIAGGAVTDEKIAPGTITGDKVNVGTLPTVPSAANSATTDAIKNSHRTLRAGHEAVILAVPPLLKHAEQRLHQLRRRQHGTRPADPGR